MNQQINPLHLSTNNECYTPSPIIEAARSLMGEIILDAASCPIANEVVQAKYFYSTQYAVEVEGEKYFTSTQPNIFLPSSPLSCIGRDGLKGDWTIPDPEIKRVTVFLNPPGGKEFSKTTQKLVKEINEETGEVTEVLKFKTVQWGNSNQVLWLDKLLEQYEKGFVYEAVFVCFNINLLFMKPILHKFPFCFPDASGTSDCVSKSSGRIYFDEINEYGDRVRQGSPTQHNLLIYLPPKDHLLWRIQEGNFEELFSQFGTVRLP